jgi:hypothetical protein
MNELAISSIGAPHELHADRIVANMLKHFAQQNAKMWDVIHSITKGPFVRDGNPRAQKKLAERVKTAGAEWVQLTPGKRGRYRLSIYAMVGWNPNTDSIIEVGDTIPPKPWLADMFHTITGLGRGLIECVTHSALFITHHSLSRCVQRWQARTLADLLKVIKTISTVALEYIVKLQDKIENDDANWHHTPPDGIRVPLPNDVAVVVLKAHEKFRALVVVTVF